MRKRELKQIIATLREENRKLIEAAKERAVVVTPLSDFVAHNCQFGFVFNDGGDCVIQGGAVDTLNQSGGTVLIEQPKRPLYFDNVAATVVMPELSPRG